MTEFREANDVVVRPREFAGPLAFAVGAVVLVGVWPMTSSANNNSGIAMGSVPVVEPLVVVDAPTTEMSRVDSLPDGVPEFDDTTPSSISSSMLSGPAAYILTTDVQFDRTVERTEAQIGFDDTALSPPILEQPKAPTESSTSTVAVERDNPEGEDGESDVTEPDITEPGEVLQLVRWVSSPTLVRVSATSEVRESVVAAILRIRSSYLDAVANPGDAGRQSLALSDRSGFMRSIASSALAKMSIVSTSTESISIGEIVTVDADRSIASVCVVTSVSGLVATLDSDSVTAVSLAGQLGFIYNGTQWILDDGNMSMSGSGC